MRDFRIACGQFAPEPGATGKNVASMIAYAGEARDLGCEFIVFPELILTGYLAPDLVLPLAEPLDGPCVQTLSKTACDLGIAIAFGMAELDPSSGARYDSLVVLGRDGELAGVYHKTHLWSSERDWAEPGTVVPVFDVDGVLCSGWICYDTRFPEVGRLAALGGADLGLVATAWLGPGDEWELAMRARALDNSLFVAGADIISYDPVLRCYGKSVIVDPKGNVLAQAEPEQEGIIWAELKGEVLEVQRDRVPLLADRKPGLYGALTKCE